MGHVEAGRGGGWVGMGEERRWGGGAEGAMSESPYVVSYKWMVGGGGVGFLEAYWPGFRRRLRGGDSKWNVSGGVTTG